MDIFIGTLIGLCLFKIFKILSKKIQASNKQQNKKTNPLRKTMVHIH